MKGRFQDKIGIVILAAGSSWRLGRPKQLLQYKESTLLKNTISEALKVPNSFVIVVTGSSNEIVEEELGLFQITKSYNKDWETGISSSIIKGLDQLLELNPDCEQCIFAVCDQPFVNNLIFENLIQEHFKTEKGIIASAYSGTLGTPVLFHKKYFAALQELKGREGAKKIIAKYLEDTASVSFEKGNVDIDTEEDYKGLFS